MMGNWEEGICCVPCLEFKNGFCPQADACGHSHGILEERFHPMLFRTRYCWYMTTCKRQDLLLCSQGRGKKGSYCCSICAFSESLRPSKSISTAALSIGVKNPVTIYPTHSMMQTLWRKQSSDYKQQQSQLQQPQQMPAISFNRPSPSPQSFCGTNAGENDQFVTFDELSGEKVNFTTTNLHNENGLLRAPNCSSITGHSSQWGF